MSGPQTAKPGECRLCGQTVDPQTGVFADGLAFCCHGCRDVWRLLDETQMAQLLSGSVRKEALRPSTAGGLKGEETVPEAQLRRLARTDRPSTDPQTATLELDGLWCASCTVLVDHVLRREPGVLGLRVDFSARAAEIAYDAKSTSADRLCEAVRSLGYGARERGDSSHPESSADRRLFGRLAGSAVLSAAVMMLSVPVWWGGLGLLAPQFRTVLETALLLLATPVAFWGGWPFLRGAAAALRHHAATMDLLVASGSLSAYAYSLISFFTGQAIVYFDTASLLTTFLLLSKALEAATKRRVSGIFQSLGQFIENDMATLLTGETETPVPSSRVRPGDRLVIRPGRRIPVDGRVESGVSQIDESVLTGEPAGVDKTAGDLVYAGSRNLSGVLVIEALRTKGETLLDKTARLVQEALRNKGPWPRLTDAALAVFVPGVFGAAALSAAYSGIILHLGPEETLMRAAATLVIACPCALSVAAPFVSMAAHKRLGGLGILPRDAEAMERLSRIDTVVFDKTGTLTVGRLRMTRILAYDETELLGFAAAAEWASEHPVAAAIVQAAKDRAISVAPAESFFSSPGDGVRARVSGRTVEVGAVAPGEAVDPAWEEEMRERLARSETVVAVRVDRNLSGLVFLTDPLREEAADCVQSLKNRGIQVLLCTGDRTEPARGAGNSAGIAVLRARQTPADKLEWVRELQRAGRRVAFVGDGVNDAPALAQADLGVAMAHSADLARDAGHLSLALPDLRAIPEALSLGRKARRILRQNIAWALAYNSLAIPAAAAGFTSPAVAAFAMAASSAMVLGNTLRLLGHSGARFAARAGLTAGAVAALAAMAWLKL